METALNIPGGKGRATKNPNARAFAASTGVTVALIAAAVLAFVSIGAYVAFEGMPFGSGEESGSTVALGSEAPEAAARAAAPTAASVAADPATPSAAALAEITAALPPGAIAGTGEPDSGGGGTTTTITGGGDGPAPGPVPVPATGPVQGTVGSIDDTASGAGLDLPLSELTDPVTKSVDDTVGGALNNVGSSVGAGNLGDKVNGTLNGLLGGGG